MKIQLNRFTYKNPFSKRSENKQSLWTGLCWTEYIEDVLGIPDLPVLRCEVKFTEIEEKNESQEKTEKK